MTKQEEIINTIKVLRNELEVHKSRLKPAGTGHLHTAIGVITSRIDELIEEVTAPYWKDEDGDIGRLPGQTRSSHLRSIEGAERVRLRKIQDSAAGRWTANEEGHWSPDENIEEKHTPDDVEHTKEYYTAKDRNRNAMSTASAEALGS